MNTSTNLPHPKRFHALDATRAFALLLGVVFHAVWYYAYGPFGTGVKDISANHFFSWFFHEDFHNLLSVMNSMFTGL